MNFGRIITAMVTPFDENLRIDWPKVKTLIDHLIEEQQTDSLVICGTTGESPTLTDEEKIELFKKSVEFANGRCKIIAGTGSNDTAHSVALTQEAEQCGVDGIMLVAPYYNRPSQEGIYQHFKTIAESTKLPVMLYNIPIRTGVTISAETTIRLSQIPNIFATKEASGNLDEITKIIAQTNDDFIVYSGDDSSTLPILSIGGYGVVSVASHVIGKEIRQMVTHFVEGRTNEAAKLHAQLFPIFSGLFICPNPVPVKYALQLRGLDSGKVRLPLVEPTEEQKAFIAKLFE